MSATVLRNLVQRLRRASATVLAIALSLSVAALPVLAAAVTRLAGQDRYGTMAAIVSEGFARNDWAIVATGENFPDFLSSAGLAGSRGCPILLTKRNALSNETKAQLERLGVKSVYLMGGESAISTDVESQIKGMGITVAREGGGDRVGTSIRAMAALRESGSKSDAVVIVTGANFADSVSIGPWAYKTKSPIILTNGDGTLNEWAISAIKRDGLLKRVIIVGGTSAVKDSVKTQLGNYKYERIFGKNRYETNREVARWATKSDLNWKYPTISTGENYPDALTASAFCGKKSSPVLLASNNALAAQSESLLDEPAQDPVLSLLYDHATEVETLYILGGDSVVSTTIEDLAVRLIWAGVYKARGYDAGGIYYHDDDDDSHSEQQYGTIIDDYGRLPYSEEEDHTVAYSPNGAHGNPNLM